MQNAFAISPNLLGLAAQPAAQMPYGWHMHDWMSSWWGPWSMLVPLILFVAFVGGIMLLIQKFPSEQRREPERRASDMLDERYAKGEIDRDEYLRRRRDIQGV
jgi:putative membrane protein